MPFTETTLMDERFRFIAGCLSGGEAMTSLCLRYGISRKTGYKWLNRYRAEGALGLQDQSRAPHRTGHSLSGEISARILSLRNEHPSWGPRKLLARLAHTDPDVPWPAASTVGDLLRRHGLTHQRDRRRRADNVTGPSVSADAINESWSADFKGWFRTGDGLRCEPLTISDNHSRYLFACHAVPRITFDCVSPLFQKVFQDHGMPRAMRTDNGAPFAHRMGLGGLTRLSVWFLKLGIWPDRIAVGRPDQNGRHERMHRTLAEDTASPPAATLGEQQQRLDAWRQVYNTIRPHEGLNNQTPAQIHKMSGRPYPNVIRPWDYPADHLPRRVSGKGYIKWKDGHIYLTEALANETVALFQDDTGAWIIRFREFDIAPIDEVSNQLIRSPVSRSGHR